MTGLLQRLFITAAWVCVGLLVLLSLAPLPEGVRTPGAGRFEHVVAYGGTTLLFLAAQRWPAPTVLLAVAALGGALEAAQGLTPYRRAAFLDFASSSFGVLCGFVLFKLAVAALATRR